MKAPLPPIEPPIVLSSPVQVRQYTLIEITLTKGGEPLSNQAVSVSTPSGAISATTDSQGIARVNAAEGGIYSFSYGNQSASTTVAAADIAASNESNPPASQNETQPAGNPNSVPQQPQANGLLAGFAALLAIFTLVVLAAVAIVAAKFIREGRKKENEESIPGHEHAHEGHEHSHGAHQHSEEAKGRHTRK
jgi:hypothetical protein